MYLLVTLMKHNISNTAVFGDWNHNVNTIVPFIIFRSTGIPCFRDIHGKAVVVGGLRQANQPDHISKRFGQIFCCFIYPGNFWIIDETTKLPKKQEYKPGNLSPSFLTLCCKLYIRVSLVCQFLCLLPCTYTTCHTQLR